MPLVEEKVLYAIKPPSDGMLTDFPFSESISITKDGAWKKFCYPALRREAYENDGFKAVKVKMTLEEI